MTDHAKEDCLFRDDPYCEGDCATCPEGGYQAEADVPVKRHPLDFEDYPTNEQREAFKRGGR